MGDKLRFLVLFAGCTVLSLSSTTATANTSILRCNSNKDQVWVYDSLTNFDIAVKLNCGETVEIVERVRDYVKIRTEDGVEGYVPESQISSLPVFHDPTPDVGTVAKQIQAKEIARAAESQSLLEPPEASAGVAAPLHSAPRPANTDTSNKKASAGVLINPIISLAEINSSPNSGLSKETAASESVKAPETSEVIEPATTSIEPPARSTAEIKDANDNPNLEPNVEREDPACRSYFSAYGLTSNQLKWITQNRKKMFPSICPAPDLTRVNSVIIFTHDVDFFSVTMPQAVHNINGFSDFHAMTTVDSALMPSSGANNAHREYVWVFQFANGKFDPESFSPHRRYQFSKVESNTLGSSAGTKVVEDAFRFLEVMNR